MLGFNYFNEDYPNEKNLTNNISQSYYGWLDVTNHLKKQVCRCSSPRQENGTLITAFQFCADEELINKLIKEDKFFRDYLIYEC
ncbi:MAG: hypothetical protein ACTSXY_12300 [Promethearchaeota archaeon]